MRWTELALIPTTFAIMAEVQWVVSAGGSVWVSITTRSVTLEPSGRMREGRVLSRRRPSYPSCMKRSCQRQTQVFDLPVRRMISLVPIPSPLNRTISARQTCLCGVLRSRTSTFRRRRSAGLSVMGIPVRIRQTRMRLVRWESPPGFKCQTRSTRQILDVYQPIWRAGAPVVIFIHGGAYVRGDKDFYGEMYGNISTWFARQGVLGLNATYRLAPAAKWPSGADDVRGMVKWAKENAAKFGGDGQRIYLMGQSAGATHVASYIFDKSLQPADGPGVAGAVLISGRYRLEYDPADPNGKNMQAYFGEDASAYADRSPITHIRDGARVPVFTVITEYDNPGLDVVGAELLAALCARDGACPRFRRLEKLQSSLRGVRLQHRRRAAWARDFGFHAPRPVTLAPPVAPRRAHQQLIASVRLAEAILHSPALLAS